MPTPERFRPANYPEGMTPGSALAFVHHMSAKGSPPFSAPTVATLSGHTVDACARALIEAAQLGWIITLDGGTTYVGKFRPKAKAKAGAK